MKKIYSQLAILLILWACLPSFVSAHAYIYQSAPLADAELKTSPSEIKLTFTEKVDTKLSSIKLLDNADGKEIKGSLSNDGDQTLIYTIPELSKGIYKVKWQVLSLDTHVTDGSYLFAVGVELESQAPEDTLSLDGAATDLAANGDTEQAETPNPALKPEITVQPSPMAKPDATTAPLETSPPTVTVKPDATPIPGTSDQQAEPSSVNSELNEEEGSTAANELSTDSPEEKDGDITSSEMKIVESADDIKRVDAASEHDEATTSVEQNHHDHDQDQDLDHEHAGGHTLMVIIRVAEVLSAIAAGGVLFFRYALWRKEKESPPWGFSLRAERIILLTAVLILLVTGWARLDMLSNQFDGVSWSDILSSTMVGRVAVMRPSAALFMLLLAFAPEKEHVWTNPLKWVIAIAVTATFPLTGHAYAAADDALAAILTHIIHMGAGAIWFGGLAGIWSLTYKESATGQLTAVADRFPQYALPSIAVVSISGVWLTAAQLSFWSQLWSSEYGRLALVKCGLMLLVIVAAVIHKGLRSRPQGKGALVIGVRIEAALAAALIVFAGWLSTTSPPEPERHEVFSEPFYWHVMGEKAHMTLRIDPTKDINSQRVRLYVWLGENSGAPASAQVRLVSGNEGDSSNAGSKDPIVVPVEGVPLENEPFEFPGFKKYAYQSEGSYIPPKFAGTVEVEVTESSGESYRYERKLSLQRDR